MPPRRCGWQTCWLATLGGFLLSGLAAAEENWPGWRGPRGDGVSLEPNVPTTWNGTTGDNIAWKVAIPGRGHGSPIIWENRIFLVSCLEETGERVLIALDRATGKTIWQQVVLKAPLEHKHNENSFASCTPVTDGKSIYVSFLAPNFGSVKERTPGKMVVAAYDFSGERKWLTPAGDFASVHGFCTSPILFEKLVIVNGDHDGDSYLAALHCETGEIAWKVNREHKTRSYGTPLVREIEGRTQMVLAGSKRVTSYDPRTGKIHWFFEGPTQQFVASMVYNGRYFFLTCGFPERHVVCLRANGTGDVSETAVVWRSHRGAGYVPSPIIVGDYYLVVSDEGIGSCFQANEGKRLWQERMGKHYHSSLVTAGGLVYFTADDGITKVVRPGETLQVEAENPLGEYVYASPAIHQSQILMRGEKNLYCIGKRVGE